MSSRGRRERASAPNVARCAVAVFLGLLALAHGAAAPAGAEEGRTAGVLPSAGVAVAGAGESVFPPWSGRHDEIETLLQVGAVIERSRIGVGVTNPWKVTLERGGDRADAVWKPLVENPSATYNESWRAEVAAYRLNRYLGLDLVPPTVARTLDGEEGSLQLWVEGYRPYAEVPDDAPRPGVRWLHQLDRMRLFDAFIDNDDRNAGNFLVDDEWHLVLIDHSRALPLKLRPRPLPPLSKRFDRGLVDRLRGLERAELRLLLGDLFSGRELSAILRQRDRVVKQVDKLTARGRATFFGDEDESGDI